MLVWHLKLEKYRFFEKYVRTVHDMIHTTQCDASVPVHCTGVQSYIPVTTYGTVVTNHAYLMTRAVLTVMRYIATSLKKHMK